MTDSPGTPHYSPGSREHIRRLTAAQQAHARQALLARDRARAHGQLTFDALLRTPRTANDR